MKPRVGIGFDLHKLGPGNALVLGGISIPFEQSLVGHSDGDVLIHAVTDAVLGACGLPNIGELFPDVDARYRGVSSIHFLEKAAELIRQKGFAIGNIDCNVLAERPKLAPYFREMESKIASVLGLSAGSISVKAKTMEKIGPIGRGEAIAAEAVALVFAAALNG